MRETFENTAVLTADQEGTRAIGRLLDMDSYQPSGREDQAGRRRKAADKIPGTFFFCLGLHTWLQGKHGVSGMGCTFTTDSPLSLWHNWPLRGIEGVYDPGWSRGLDWRQPYHRQ